jgi:hypothetical protein
MADLTRILLDEITDRLQAETNSENSIEDGEPRFPGGFYSALLLISSKT